MRCARALAKLDAALGSREVVGLDIDAPEHLATVRAAADVGEGGLDRLPVGSRDELTTRVVEPVQVITIDGHWYLDAYCHRAGDMRRFRVDPIGRARRGRSPRRPPPSVPRRDRPLQEMFMPGPGAVEVQLRLGPDPEWVPESGPVRAVAPMTAIKASCSTSRGWPGSSGSCSNWVPPPVWSTRPR